MLRGCSRAIGLPTRSPDREQAIAANTRIDTKLTGSNPIDVLIQFPDALLYARKFHRSPSPSSATSHSVLEHQRGIGNVWSRWNIRRWLATTTSGKADVGTLKRYVDMLPEYSDPTVPFPPKKRIRWSSPGAFRTPTPAACSRWCRRSTIHSTPCGRAIQLYDHGQARLSALAARNSALMIDKLNRGLTIEIVFVAAFIEIAFGSLVPSCWP